VRTDLEPVPVIAIVGRPNVGKSTLFNRLIGRRRAIVGDEPGITRDRIYGQTEWGGRRLRVVDTGGIIPHEKEHIPAEIFRQARVALEEASAVVMLVDVRTELAAPDLELARLLLRTGKPLFLAVNKVDVPSLEWQAEEFRRLGVERVFPVSAEHGTGVAELLDAILEVIPTPKRPTAEDAEKVIAQDDRERDQEIRVAIIGRPNVGKSTLLNQLTGTARAIVSPTPGTTRDAVDEIVRRDGAVYHFIDTAGIRRKGKTKLMAEKLSVVMARKHLEAADVSLLVIDATEGVTALDANIAGYAHESGRSVVLVVNKWDAVGGSQPPGGDGGSGRVRASRKIQQMQTRKTRPDAMQFEQQVRRGMKFLAYAPVLFVSALTGKNLDRLFNALALVASERSKRISTAEMNRFLETLDLERAPLPKGKKIKIYYMTQASTSPPTFVLFTDRAAKLHFSFERFLENQIRRGFGFVGTPIRIINRARHESKIR